MDYELRIEFCMESHYLHAERTTHLDRVLDLMSGTFDAHSKTESRSGSTFAACPKTLEEPRPQNSLTAGVSKEGHISSALSNTTKTCSTSASPETERASVPVRNSNLSPELPVASSFGSDREIVLSNLGSGAIHFLEDVERVVIRLTLTLLLLFGILRLLKNEVQTLREPARADVANVLHNRAVDHPGVHSVQSESGEIQRSAD